MSTTATQTVARPRKDITKARSTTSATTQPPPTRSKSNLTETKRQILSNISDALRHDIELKRHEQAALKAQKKITPATKPLTASKPTTNPPPRQPPSPSRPAFEPSRQPNYCTYRPPIPRPSSLYHTLSPARPCTCTTPQLPLHPQQWTTTPAEAQDLKNPTPPHTPPNSNHATVKFADDPVSEVWVFERWYQDEYEFSDSYYAKGPVRVTEDWSTVVDDDAGEIAYLEAAEGLDSESSDEEDKDEVVRRLRFDEGGCDEGAEAEDADGGPLMRMH